MSRPIQFHGSQYSDPYWMGKYRVCCLAEEVRRFVRLLVKIGIRRQWISKLIVSRRTSTLRSREVISSLRHHHYNTCCSLLPRLPHYLHAYCRVCRHCPYWLTGSWLCDSWIIIGLRGSFGVSHTGRSQGLVWSSVWFLLVLAGRESCLANLNAEFNVSQKVWEGSILD